jgi:5-methyltetrahydrofolate--homocysteine methyltransferase
MRRNALFTQRARELRRNENAAERRMWSILRAKRMSGFKFRRQHALGRYIADFICLKARLVIEVDGDTHGTDESPDLDAKRAEEIEQMGYRVIRFWNHQVLTASDDVAAAIFNALHTDPAGAPIRDSPPAGCLGTA